MFIDRVEWEKLKEYIDVLYWDEDRMSRDGLYFLKKLDNQVANIEKNSSSKFYIVTNSGVCDDEEYNYILSITPSLELAKKTLKEEINYLKEELDFDKLDVINITADIDLNNSKYDCSWLCNETDMNFSLYQNGEYNSNHFNVSIEKREVEVKKNIKEKEVI